jgi:hypothetical protein
MYFEKNTYPTVCIVHTEFNLLPIRFHSLMGSRNHKMGHYIALPIVTSDLDIPIKEAIRLCLLPIVHCGWMDVTLR